MSLFGYVSTVSTILEMPQSKGKSTGFVFRSVGKGKAPELTLDGSIRTWKRAEILNHREAVNLRTKQQFIARQAHVTTEEQRRIAARIQRSLDILRAYRSLILNEYKIANFETLTWGYRTPDPVKEPERFQRFVYESKIYHSGFSVHTLQREVSRRLEEMKADHQREVAKTEHIERLKNQCKIELFDRTKSLTAILRERKQNTGKLGKLKLPPLVQIKRSDLTTHCGSEADDMKAGNDEEDS